MFRRLLIAAGLTAILFVPGGTAIPVPWVNGDFSQGALGWTVASSVVIGDHDDDGDQEAFMLSNGGNIQIAKGIGKGVVQASSPMGFNIERGALVYDARMVILCAAEPEPYVNDYLPNPNWVDDQVLAWIDWDGAAGPQYLDPVQAQGINIPGWAGMGPAERSAYLDGCFHMSFVLYAAASGYEGGATVDNFLFHV